MTTKKVIKTYYDATKRKIHECYEVNEAGEKDGEYKEFWPSYGHFWGTCHTPEAGIKLQGTYENGLKQGAFIHRHENGLSYCIEPYKNDKLDGLLKYFYQDGKTLESTQMYKNGVLDGEGYYYNIHSQITAKVIYEGGKLKRSALDVPLIETPPPPQMISERPTGNLTTKQARALSGRSR